MLGKNEDTPITVEGITTSTENTKYKHKKKKPKKPLKWTKRFLCFLLVCTTVLSTVSFGGVLYIREKLSSLPMVDAQYLNTYETSKILDKNGDIIWRSTDKRISTIEYEEIPEFYKTTLIAVEDETFWTSNGYSVAGIGNMIYGAIRSQFDDNYTARGGSTIDQQLIKNRFFNGGNGIATTTRKIQEIFLAIQLNENFTKEEILTFYVNELEFNEGSTGIKTIMMTYFGKTPEDYTERTIDNIAEQAYLVGLSQAPSRYNIYADEEAAHERMKTVLTVLLNQELITQEEYDEAKNFDLTTNLQPRGWEAVIQHEQNLKYKVYTDCVIDEIESLGYNIDEVSLTIQTFLDPEVFDSVTELVRNPKYYLDDQQQVAVTVIDSDGIVVAMVGSTNEENDELNRAIQQTRSSGSSTKPFTAYGPLLQYFGDKYTTASTFDSSNYQYPGTSSIMRNAGYGEHGMVSMLQALRYSYNTPVARIIDNTLGSGRTKAFLNAVGLDVKDTYSSVDGIGLNISTLQNAAAYNTLNNLGEYTKPRFINTITFSDGTIKEVSPIRSQAMNESTAWVINHMLQGVPSTTAINASIPQYVGYAGKTGIVAFDSSINPPSPYGQGDSDVWYSSYTNKGFSISVWVGYDIPNESPQIPSYYCGQQLINKDLQVMLNTLIGNNPSQWEMPDTVTRISGSGLSAHYKITDAHDIGDSYISWVDIADYNSFYISDATANEEVNENWEEDETSSWLQSFRNGSNTKPSIVDPDIYNNMRGDE